MIRQALTSSPIYLMHLGQSLSMDILGSHIVQKSLKNNCILKSQLILLSFTIESGSTVCLVNSYTLSCMNEVFNAKRHINLFFKLPLCINLKYISPQSNGSLSMLITIFYNRYSFLLPPLLPIVFLFV